MRTSLTTGAFQGRKRHLKKITIINNFRHSLAKGDDGWVGGGDQVAGHIDPRVDGVGASWAGMSLPSGSFLMTLLPASLPPRGRGRDEQSCASVSGREISRGAGAAWRPGSQERPGSSED